MQPRTIERAVGKSYILFDLSLFSAIFAIFWLIYTILLQQLRVQKKVGRKRSGESFGCGKLRLWKVKRGESERWEIGSL